jgi:hypothetical protein
MIKDINWGAVILGAAAAVAIVASGTGAALLANLAEMGVAKGVTVAGAGIVGGVIGDMVSKVFHRAQDAGTTLIGR